jgi:3-hydroxybutyryl-CoA dehydrogenase/5-formyl-3-hydroxy-2-methylpyridine 4-carboxylate dehydrogenase
MKHIAVIGLGTMGPGIAQRLARGGLVVSAFDTEAVQIDKAKSALPLINGVLDRLGIAPKPGGEVRFTASLAEAVNGADLVIENVPERIEIKAQVYRAIDGLIGANTLVVSDTSGIPISKLQEHLSRPERFCGMHWSNPPHIIPMIEVISGAKTAPETANAVVDLIESLGLLPVVINRDVPGFVENRILYALLREAIDLVEEGVIAPEALDTCVSWGIGYKLSVIGPMALLDVAGLDIYHSVASFLNRELSTRADIAPFITKRVGENRLGLKTGSGVYAYTPENGKELAAQRARKLVAVRRALEEKDAK